MLMIRVRRFSFQRTIGSRDAKKFIEKITTVVAEPEIEYDLVYEDNIQQ